MVKFSELISKILRQLFETVGAEYKVDKVNHKLTGQSLFQILLYNASCQLISNDKADFISP